MNFRCACGKAIVVSPIVPDDIWTQIHGGDYALCVECIDARLQAKQLKCEPYLHFAGQALRTHHPEWAARVVAAFKPEPDITWHAAQQ